MDLIIQTDQENVYKMYKDITTNTKCHYFNIYFVKDEMVYPNKCIELDLKISCNLKKLNTGLKLKTQQLYTNEPFWVIPNTYISKTPLIPQNTPMYIEPENVSDSIKVNVFNYSNKEFPIKTGMSLFKIVSGGVINKAVTIHVK